MSTVLIIDDEPNQVAGIRDVLGEETYMFEVATSVAEARRILGERGDSINAVLLDWVLRDTDGVELLRWIKEQPELENVEVIIQSAELIPERIRAGIECGAYYYLSKPYVHAQLQAIVRAAVGCGRLKRKIQNEANEASDVLRLLNKGVFHVRTLQDSHALSARLAAACRDPHKGMAVFELLVNAVEHGNLGISYEDKSKLLAEGTHKAEIRRRLEMEEHRRKRVHVELEREKNTLRILIRDCGDGFDYRKYLTVDPERMFHSHGRGVMVASSQLDIEYVDPGNEVRVTMKLQA